MSDRQYRIALYDANGVVIEGAQYTLASNETPILGMRIALPLGTWFVHEVVATWNGDRPSRFLGGDPHYGGTLICNPQPPPTSRGSEAIREHPGKQEAGLDVSLRRWPNDLHRMRASDLCEFLVADVGTKQRRREVIEVSDHRRTEVEVQLPARHASDSEAGAGLRAE